MNGKWVLLFTLLPVLCSPLLVSAQNGDELIMAVMYQDVAEVKNLLADGVDVNYQEPQNRTTALILASNYGLVEIASMLLDAGADVNIHNKQGHTALIAAAGNSLDLVEMLIRQGADPLAETKQGTTGFTAAIVGALMQRVSTDVAEIFLAAGADVDEAARSGNTEGYTCLMMAANNQRPDLVRFLLENGADPKLKAADSSTALGLAQENGDSETVQLLIKAGAKQ
jgi:ankyrin repeat protein